MAESVSKSRGKGRRLSQMVSSTNTLRETLSAFGDDVVRMKDANEVHSPFEDGIVNPSTGGLHQFDLLTSQPMRFERVPSAEVGVRSSRWRKAIVAGLVSSSGKISKSSRGDEGDRGQGDDNMISSSRRPPFWGVSVDTRGKVSMLTLQLLIHEIACFASVLLLGLLIVQVFEGFSWIKEGREMKSNWLFIRLYGSLATALLVITSIGFLLRIDTKEKGALLTSPLYFIPTIVLAISDYFNKAWELQREECLNYFKMDEKLRSQVHLTQNCTKTYSTNYNSNPNVSQDPTVIIMRVVPVISCLFISIYLFCTRDNFYLAQRFRRNSADLN